MNVRTLNKEQQINLASSQWADTVIDPENMNRKERRMRAAALRKGKLKNQEKQMAELYDRIYGNHYYQQLVREIVQSDQTEFKSFKPYQYSYRKALFCEFDTDYHNSFPYVMIYRSPHTDKLMRIPIDAQDIRELKYLEKTGSLVQ